MTDQTPTPLALLAALDRDSLTLAPGAQLFAVIDGSKVYVVRNKDGKRMWWLGNERTSSAKLIRRFRLPTPAAF